MQHYSVIIVGGGQAGLAISHYCQKYGLSHLVLEKGRIMNAWKDKRWDSFTLVTPNWQCLLPEHPYDGDDPHGFMNREQIIAYLDRFAEKVAAPVLEHTEVLKVSHDGSRYQVHTSNGDFVADQVVVAAGSYQQPIIPRLAERLPADIQQMHSEQYKNPGQLQSGAVLVVGSGQSGAQIAEDLHLAGKQVHLAVGEAPRCARFYRGRDVVDWLTDMKYYEMPVHEHPLKEGVRDNTNHYVTGRDGGRDIDLRRFALEGMELYGKLRDGDARQLQFTPTLKAALDSADATYNSINERIDQYIEKHRIEAPPGQRYQPLWQPPTERESLDLATAGITDVIWCIGFRPDYHWLEVPVFDGKGYPTHVRGVTAFPGLYFIGLPWLYTWGSGRFSGVDQDACHVVEHICARARSSHWKQASGLYQLG
ncbi:MSMEG_0569 family flavin-dependent oxidoreductase [Ketobacter sp.]|uniref:MSMEG_0569 family flavin-dependent oxidoreductase n=1 Tax=Ketobacter sp. TaxID=2083498 RepID=UPI000F27DA0E|nr:MSMEG_0569 family flavin-dependent oxidoreductase [Ketobacter sp.]RLT92166.1 MAG: MSMEG_0569 family flavin-dependent oxidoreductase [Ketobacter sp.]